MKKTLFAVIGISLISIMGMLFLQNTFENNSETVFFTLQGENTVNSFPNNNNWIAGEKNDICVCN